MRCHLCKSSNVKSAEQYGAERLQCGSCGTLTKRAELQLTEYQQKLINYLSSWSSEYVENAWEVTQDIDQNGIAKGIGISRSNIPRIIGPLLDAKLVRQRKAHILDENNRVSPRKKLVYYLAPAGKKYVSKRAESRQAETFEADEWWDGIYEDGTTYKGRYPHWRDCGCPEKMLELRGDWGNCFEFHCENHGYVAQICATQMRDLLERRPFDMTVAGFRELNPSANLGGETFEATRGEMRQRRRTPFYELPYEEESEDKDVNKFARTNAGGALWQATYQALRDEGRSHEQAETFCNTKFFDHYYEYIIEGLRQPMRNLINRLQKPRLGLTRKHRKDNRQARKRVDKYFPDMASEEFDRHRSRNKRKKCNRSYCTKPIIVDFNGYCSQLCESKEKPDWMAAENTLRNPTPLSPTRPSEDWPTPDGRPRRPRRKPNPRPGPARRPF